MRAHCLMHLIPFVYEKEGSGFVRNGKWKLPVLQLKRDCYREASSIRNTVRGDGALLSSNLLNWI